MARTKRLLLAFALALGLVATAANYLPLAAGATEHQVAGSKGDRAGAGRDSSIAGSKGCRPPNESRACRESSYQLSFIDDEEIIEQIAGSKGEMAGAGRDPSILGSMPDELQVAGSRGCGESPSRLCRESS